MKTKSAPSIFPNFSFIYVLNIVKEMWDRSAETVSNYLINLMAAAAMFAALRKRSRNQRIHNAA